jgi:hypothetical protein
VFAAARKQDDQGASRIPSGQPFEPSLNPRSAPEVAQIVEPSRKAVCLAQLDHRSVVALRLRPANHRQVERPDSSLPERAARTVSSETISGGRSTVTTCQTMSSSTPR